MRKKTSLALALLHNPRVLFLDEPFEGVDPVTSKTIRDLLAAIAGRGITVYLTSHMLSIVDRLAGQILMLRKGRIVWNSEISEVGQPLENLYFDLVEPPRTEDLEWLGSPPS
jgi:ABC-2 type transport system ATP-binding protein